MKKIIMVGILVGCLLLAGCGDMFAVREAVVKSTNSNNIQQCQKLCIDKEMVYRNTMENSNTKMLECSCILLVEEK